MCKVVLGRIRSKYKSSSSKFELDGDQLLSEGNSEIQSIRQFLDDNKDIFTVQFHPEACPGPEDTAYIFDEFIDLVKTNKK